ncbi:Stp1/IreP family PP2C-type Ser/Thr phosphatase [Patulibacter brassicae]|uniref:Stp1/IreP family PP2C-type Ser/Thr phosphatase n=1 Tax=Patulibacter brassicae TaxID=1705717 RepID=A0ABU4VKQ9_9ACTN|nr:Stp1/IreP family PP2C-type Ser/Thr phosphatase [Patulibacter brassicae]MDX8152451.1 Stp1/IreP family PP2C-type Ser/Thr phosphatase [Patulibacter brassicae]
MLKVAEHAQRTDTGRQRPHNEDSFVARTPLFAVADGMGGAQAGEVASRVAVDTLREGLGTGSGTVAERLRDQVSEANRRIHERALRDQRRAGMGTTLTAAYVDEGQLVVVHVGDSRLYRLRGQELTRLTRDHSLVEELVRQGRLTPEQALEHPQRSIITRALGPEPEVAIDSEVLNVEDDDLFLVCSDGLTAMLSEEEIEEILAGPGSLDERVDLLVDRANEAGGRDNITVLLFRVENAGTAPSALAAGSPAADEEPTQAHEQVTAVLPRVDADQLAAAASAEEPRPPRGSADGPRTPRTAVAPRKRRGVRAGPFIVLFLLFCVLVGGYFASQTVYFVGNHRGLVTVYRGLPYELPAGLKLYSVNYPSAVPVDEVDAPLRRRLLDHRLRSLADANDLVSKLERGEVVKP